MDQIWGDTRDMEIEVIARKDQDDFDLAGEITRPYAVTMSSSNGGLVVEGTTAQLSRWTMAILRKVEHEAGGDLCVVYRNALTDLQNSREDLGRDTRALIDALTRRQ